MSGHRVYRANNGFFVADSSRLAIGRIIRVIFTFVHVGDFGVLQLVSTPRTSYKTAELSSKYPREHAILSHSRNND
jgi:hypothetical protein